MKKLVLAAALTGLASTAFAGGMAEPVMEPEVIVEETSGTTAGGIVVPLVLLALIAAVALEAGATSVVAWLFRKRARDLDDGPSLNAALKAGHVALMALIALLLGCAFLLALASRFGWNFDLSTARAQAIAANVVLALVVLTELIRAAFTLMLLPRR